MNDELLKLFFSEAEELIQAMESGLLALEKNPEDKNVVNSVFRAAHTLKGNTATIGGLDQLVEFTHLQENVLDMLRQGRLALTEEVTSLLLSSVDVLKDSFRDIVSGRTLDENRFRETETRLKDIRPSDRAKPAGPPTRQPTPPPPPPEPRRQPTGPMVEAAPDPTRLLVHVPGLVQGQEIVFTVEKAAVAEALFADRHIFVLHVVPGLDLTPQGRTWSIFDDQLATFGQVLAATPRDRLEEAQCLLVSTILEETPLLAEALSLPEGRILAPDPEAWPAALTSSSPQPSPVPAPSLLPPKQEAKPLPMAAPVVTTAEPAPRRTIPATMPPPRPERGRSSAPETVRVGVELIDRLMNLAGELVLSRNQLRRHLQGPTQRTKGLAALLQHFDRVTTDIQERTILMRMQPVGQILNRFPRMVRDLSHGLAKEVEIEIHGAEVELDKSILEGLIAPMTDLVSYSVHNGLESPEIRARAGKDPVGRIIIKARHEQGQVWLTVSDNGRGLDPEQVLVAALNRNLTDSTRARTMTETEKLGLVFLPGVSTARRVIGQPVSSVGLGRVKADIEKIGGSIRIESGLTLGTAVHLRLPLTLAIIPGLLVGSGGHSFAIPQRDVLEMVGLPGGEAARGLEIIGGSKVLRLRRRLLPLVDLARLLKLRSRATESSEAYVVVLRLGTHRFGLIVDELLDMEEIVVKPLSNHAQEYRFFSGTTIMGDGAVTMILNPAGLAEEAGLNLSEVGAEETRRQAAENTRSQDDLKLSLLLFTCAPDEYFALPLTSISRLEMIRGPALTRVGQEEFVTCRGASMPLIRLDRCLPVGPPAEDNQEFYVIIPRTPGPPVGIMASRIVDTVETQVKIGRDDFTPPGSIGFGVVEGRLTTFLDVGQLLALNS